MALLLVLAASQRGTEDTVIRSLMWLSKREPVGVEEIALVALAFLGAGYTHSSRETYDGVHFGDVVRGRLQFLIATPADDDEAAALRSLALCEAYRLTGSNRFKPHAQAAIDEGLRRRCARGTWGTVGATAWWMEACRRAESAGLRVDPAGIDGAIWTIIDPDPEIASRARVAPACIVGLDATAEAQRLSAMLRAGLGSPSVEAMLIEEVRNHPVRDTAFWFWAASTLYRSDGDVWESAAPVIRDRLADAQSAAGDWGGTVADTARAALAAEIAYQYPSVVGGWR